MRGVQVAFFVAAIALFAVASANDSRQSLQSKNIVRDVIINSYQGPRNKRSPNEPPNDDSQKPSYSPEDSAPPSSKTHPPLSTVPPKHNERGTFGYAGEQVDTMGQAMYGMSRRMGSYLQSA